MLHSYKAGTKHVGFSPEGGVLAAINSHKHTQSASPGVYKPSVEMGVHSSFSSITVPPGHTAVVQYKSYQNSKELFIFLHSRSDKRLPRHATKITRFVKILGPTETHFLLYRV